MVTQTEQNLATEGRPRVRRKLTREREADMYEYCSVYGEKAKGLEPTEDLEEAVKNADNFEVIVYDKERKMDVYDIRNRDRKWNLKWIAQIIQERKENEECESV